MQRKEIKFSYMIFLHVIFSKNMVSSEDSQDVYGYFMCVWMFWGMSRNVVFWIP